MRAQINLVIENFVTGQKLHNTQKFQTMKFPSIIINQTPPTMQNNTINLTRSYFQKLAASGNSNPQHVHQH